MSTPSISKIVLLPSKKDQLVPLRQVDKNTLVASLNQDGSADIFRATEPNQIFPFACSIDLTNPVRVLLDGLTPKKKYSLRGYSLQSEDGMVIFEAEFETTESTTLQVDCKIILKQTSNKTTAKGPWSCRGPHTFNLSENNGPYYKYTANLELYGIQLPQPNSIFASAGKDFGSSLPLELLRLFVRPNWPGEYEVASRPKWIEWVTNVCHGSVHPATGEKQDTLNHWLKYDANSGEASFVTGQNQDQFDLDAWIKTYLGWSKSFAKRDDTFASPEPNVRMASYITTVNSLDQAGILQIALSLGIPLRQIAWESHQVFGYIKTTSLVGWGRCNNPLFRYQQSLKVIAEREMQSRWPIRRHVFISISNGDDSIKYPDDQSAVDISHLLEEDGWSNDEEESLCRRKIADACIGPYLGDISRTEYFRKVIEDEYDPRFELKDLYKDRLAGCPEGTTPKSHPERWVTVHECTKGITSLKTEDGPIRFVQAFETDYGAQLRDWNAVKAAIDTQDSNIRLVPMDTIHSTFAAATRDLKEHVAYKTEFKSWIHQQDQKRYLPDDQRGNTRYETKSQSWYTDHVVASYMYMNVHVAQNRDDAYDLLRSRMKAVAPGGLDGLFQVKTRSDTTLRSLEVSSTNPKLGFHVLGSNHLSLFVINQLLVEIGAPDGNPANLDIVTQAVALEINKSQSFASPSSLMPTASMTVPGSSEQVGQATVSISQWQVDAKQAIVIRPASGRKMDASRTDHIFNSPEEKGLMIQFWHAEPSSAGDILTLEMRKHYTQQPGGPYVIKVSCRDKETAYISQVKFPITLVP